MRHPGPITGRQIWATSPTAASFTSSVRIGIAVRRAGAVAARLGDREAVLKNARVFDPPRGIEASTTSSSRTAASPLGKSSRRPRRRSSTFVVRRLPRSSTHVICASRVGEGDDLQRDTEPPRALHRLRACHTEPRSTPVASSCPRLSALDGAVLSSDRCVSKASTRPACGDGGHGGGRARASPTRTPVASAACAAPDY